MAEEEFVAYKDISELKKELEEVKGKKDVSPTELYDSVQKLAQTITDMLDVFGAAAEQLKLEEKGYEADAKRHEAIISKLDKVMDQNKTIAEGMVAIVDLVKKNLAVIKEKEQPIFKPKEKEGPLFKPREEPKTFMPKPEWQGPRPQPIAPPIMPPMPPMPQPMAATDLGMPPMEPTPLPNLDLGEPFPLEEEPKKKSLFGMFKK
jgi:hypothetical protein